MGDVVDLTEFRRKKAKDKILGDFDKLLLKAQSPTFWNNRPTNMVPNDPANPWVSESRFREIFGDPNPSIVRISKGYRKFVPKEPTPPKVDYTWNPMEIMTAADMKLRVIENRLKMYELACYAPKITDEVFKARWPVFIALLDEYERRANALIDAYWAIRGGCRPGVALAVREEKKAVGVLLRRCNNYWFEEKPNDCV